MCRLRHKTVLALERAEMTVERTRLVSCGGFDSFAHELARTHFMRFHTIEKIFAFFKNRFFAKLQFIFCTFFTEAIEKNCAFSRIVFLRIAKNFVRTNFREFILRGFAQPQNFRSSLYLKIISRISCFHAWEF